MSNIIPINFSGQQLSAAAVSALQASQSTQRMTAGLGGEKTHRVQITPMNVLLMSPDGRAMSAPAQHMEFVFLDSSVAVERQFYAGVYQPGSSAAPDCFSRDGVHPDPKTLASGKRPMCNLGGQMQPTPSCALCPKNVKDPANGNRVPCQYFKRAAVKPIDALDGPAYSLKIPSTSLFGKGEAPLMTFTELSRQIAQPIPELGHPLPASVYVIRVSALTVHPAQFRFTVAGVLPQEEWPRVIAMETSQEVKSIIGEVPAQPQAAQAMLTSDSSHANNTRVHGQGAVPAAHAQESSGSLVTPLVSGDAAVVESSPTAAPNYNPMHAPIGENALAEAAAPVAAMSAPLTSSAREQLNAAHIPQALRDWAQHPGVTDDMILDALKSYAPPPPPAPAPPPPPAPAPPPPPAPTPTTPASVSMQAQIIESPSADLVLDNIVTL